MFLVYSTISQYNMNMKKITRASLTNSWFFKNVHPAVKVGQVFIRGDLLVVVPFLLVILVLSFVDWYSALLLFGVFYTIRFAGEIVYWLFQQFHTTGYRPYDFGLEKLSNNAIYIIYQLLAIVNTSIWLSFVLYLLFVL